MTQNCEYFKKRSNLEKIEFANGTFIKNPLFQASLPVSKQTQSTEQADLNPDQKVEEELLQDAEVFEILRNSCLSVQDIFLINKNISLIAEDSSKQFEFTWPLCNKSGTRNKVSGTTLIAALKTKLNPKKFSRLLRATQGRKAKAKEQNELQGQSNEEVSRNNRQFSARKLKAKELFDYAQQKVIQILLKGKTLDHADDNTKALAKKVGRIKYIEPDDPAYENFPDCLNGSQNAFMFPTRNSFIICSGSLTLPDDILIAMIGHEIGHSIDPCSALMESWTVDLAKLESFVDSYQFKDQGDRALLIDIYNSEATSYEQSLDLVFNDLELVKVLKNQSIFNRLPDDPVQKKYPFAEQYSCLANDAKFVETREGDVLRAKQKLIRYQNLKTSTSGLSKEEISSEREYVNRYTKALKEYPQCLSTIEGSSQMLEVTSDMIGALVLERFHADKKTVMSENEKVAAVVYITKTCRQNPPLRSASPLTFEEDLKYLSKPHPENEPRISKVFLNLPLMEKIYNCKRSGVACFDNLSIVDRVEVKQHKSETGVK